MSPDRQGLTPNGQSCTAAPAVTRLHITVLSSLPTAACGAGPQSTGPDLHAATRPLILAHRPNWITKVDPCYREPLSSLLHQYSELSSYRSLLLSPASKPMRGLK